MARPASRFTVLPSDVVQETFVSGLALTVAFELAPDDHQLFVSELYGSVRLVVDGELRPDPIVTLPTTQGLAQGALGLALDPAFAADELRHRRREGSGRAVVPPVRPDRT